MRTYFLILSFALSSLSAFAQNYRMPNAVKEQYRYLYQLPVETNPDGSKSFHNATLRKIGGLNILSLKGDRFEMAYQHGRLLRDEIKTGVVPQAAQMMPRAIRNSMGDGVVGRIAQRYMRRNVLEPLMSKSINSSGAPTELLKSAWALGEATGVSSDVFLEAAFNPEALLVILGQRAPQNRGLFGRIFGFDQLVAPVSECSAFAAWGSSTENGELIIGRNTDYGLNGYFDRHPTVIYYEPNEGQKFMSLTSAGAHNAGVFAMNESGIFIGNHTAPTTDVSKDGRPSFMVAEEILRQATTLQQALDLFAKNPPAAGWNFMLASSRERRVATIELSNNHYGIRSAETDWHIQTNHYITESMKPHFYDVNRATRDDSHNRFGRITQLIRAADGKLNLQSAMSILQDKIDLPSSQVRNIGNTIAVHTTMTSAIVLPERGMIYVANGQAPVSQNSYIQLPTIEAFDTARLPNDNLEIPNNQFPQNYPQLAASEQKFIAAKMAYEYNNDHDASARFLKEAIALNPDESVYRFNYAAIQMRAGRYDEAIVALDFLTKRGLEADDHWLHLAHYYLGAMYAERRQAENSIDHLEAVVTSHGLDPMLKQAAEGLLAKLRSRQFPKIALKQLGLMFQQGDMMQY
jgi:tetratricopeptide (TPR) repeat protein